MRCQIDFYFLMYVNLVLLCIHSMMQVRHSERLLSLTRNIPPEKIFVPLNMALIYLFTFTVFYP